MRSSAAAWGGGGVADRCGRVVFGDETTGAENDIRQATQLARSMVGRFGMSDEIGFVSILPQVGDGWAMNGASQVSERTRQRIDDEVKRVAVAVEHAQHANGALRELAHGILPADLTSAGLRGAVASMVERLDLPVRVDLCPERFAAEVEANAYFIVAEALTNIVKHAGAGSAAVTATATAEDGELRVEVRDDGVGGALPVSGRLAEIP